MPPLPHLTLTYTKTHTSTYFPFHTLSWTIKRLVKANYWLARKCFAPYVVVVT